MRSIRLLAFHVRQFLGVAYFLQLMAVATITTTVVQFLAWLAWAEISPADAWVRAGAIGAWTTCTAAAGIIGFERFKGTLVHLVMAPIGALRACGYVVASAATFGLVAFPLAWATWALLARSVSFDPFTPARFGEVALGVATFWVGSLLMCFVVAALFVLTPNAITYEGLLLTPIFLLSGLMFTLSSPPAWIASASKFLPLSWPIDVLFGRAGSSFWAGFAMWLCCAVAWGFIAWLTGRAALRRATVTGTLEVV